MSAFSGLLADNSGDAVEVIKEFFSNDWGNSLCMNNNLNRALEMYIEVDLGNTTKHFSGQFLCWNIIYLKYTSPPYNNAVSLGIAEVDSFV